MGAKQSKRSVDISGKEAESAGEVAVAGAGGEGRVEPIADADALKPQLNGDAHIQPPHEISDKEKQLDSGTPENEKDATTEKEGKEDQNGEKETNPVTNGDSEPKEENGESVPTPEDGKKPKKEKVKKKWSLRSISFSRKDKPKQEKKPKDEEPKTNGEPEKVPEEAAEATPESVENKTADIAQPEAAVKEEKTPDTPVTEPMTNGSSTPESPKVETLAADEPSAAPAPAAALPQEPVAPEPTPEQLPINGLSLDEPKKEVLEEALTEESKPETPTADATETVPAPEIPVKTEVCDAKMPLIEPTPPPLPANPPPSSVASFAATTMAPELIEASLANSTENANLTPPAIPDTAVDKPDENNSEIQQTITTNLAVIQLSPPLKEIISADIPVPIATSELEIENVNNVQETVDKVPEIADNDHEPVEPVEPEVTKMIVEMENEPMEKENDTESKTHVEAVEVPESHKAEIEIDSKIIDTVNVDVSNANTDPIPVSNTNGNESVDMPSPVTNTPIENEPSAESCTDTADRTPEPVSDILNAVDDLPPPPPEDECSIESEEIKSITNTETISREDIPIEQHDNHNGEANTNGVIDETEPTNIKNKIVDQLGNVVDRIECNGNGSLSPTLVSEASRSLPASPEAAGAPSDASDSLPPPPELADVDADADSDALHPQEPLPIADKIADLIPEIPTVPELKTETETSTEVAVAD